MAYLWACFDDTVKSFLPPAEVNRIRHNYQQTYPNLQGNPVAKIQLAILEVGEEQVDIVPINQETDNDDRMEEESDATGSGSRGS